MGILGGSARSQGGRGAAPRSRRRGEMRWKRKVAGAREGGRVQGLRMWARARRPRAKAQAMARRGPWLQRGAQGGP